MYRFLRIYSSVVTFAQLQSLRLTVWRAARMEGRAPSGFLSIDQARGDTITVGPAAFQTVLSNRFSKHARHIELIYNGVLMRARDRYKRRVLKRERIANKLESAKRRCPEDGDGAILGAVAALALSVGVSVPLSWGFIQEFEWPFLFSVIACMSLSLIDAVVSHLAGRLYAALTLDEPETPFTLTPKERTSTKQLLALALTVAVGLVLVFSILRTGNGGSIWLWLVVGLAALLIAGWSGYVGYPASRVLRVRHLAWRLGRCEVRVSKAYGALELIVRRMNASVETMRHRLLDLNHRAGITFIRSFRRHHDEKSIPPTMPNPEFPSEAEVMEQILSPLRDLDISTLLGADPRTNTGTHAKIGSHHQEHRRPPALGRPGRATNATSTNTRLRE